jgi:phosphoenolpyruvate synthase/pyruvate phosphate dikinase
MMDPLVLSFNEIGRDDIHTVGGKGANLGELTKAGFKVPPGFCLSTKAFNAFIAKTAADIYPRLDDVSPDNLEHLRFVGHSIRTDLTGIALPTAVEKAVVNAWQDLGENHPYAVRSSATAEDLPHASFAGQQDTFLNVSGKNSLLAKVKDCLISLFTDRAILYRVQNGFDHRKVAISVIVQKMVQSDVSGILFTADPITGNRNLVSIDASFGLAEALVSGIVSADLYQVNKQTLKIIKQQIATKNIAIRALPEGGNEQVEVETDKRCRKALTDDQIIALATLGSKVEAHYGKPQDIEWARSHRL